jgi:hypothetical protein
MQSGYCATFRSRTNIRSNGPIGPGATNSPRGATDLSYACPYAAEESAHAPYNRA